MTTAYRWAQLGLLLAAIPAAGCMTDMQDDDGLPGESLGTFKVQATLVDSTCGEGAFGAPDTWEFEVKLARDGSVLYWNNGSELVQGTLTNDVSFAFSAAMSIPVTEKKGAQAGCVMIRQDAASGTLASTDADGVTGFQGDLSYGYGEADGSECGPLLQEAGIQGLPCQIHYGITATRE